MSTRFWSKVDKRGPDECWPWRGSFSKGGYGDFSFGRSRKHVKAHQLAYVLTHGEFAGFGERERGEHGLCVLHSCGNPACCNPAHLRLGSHDENMQDMITHGRSTRGQRNARAKLSKRQVIAIRAARGRGVLLEALADQYGVAISTISRVATGVRWGWL
jgi:hypothetical protein